MIPGRVPVYFRWLVRVSARPKILALELQAVSEEAAVKEDLSPSVGTTEEVVVCPDESGASIFGVALASTHC